MGARLRPVSNKTIILNLTHCLIAQFHLWRFICSTLRVVTIGSARLPRCVMLYFSTHSPGVVYETLMARGFGYRYSTNSLSIM